MRLIPLVKGVLVRVRFPLGQWDGDAAVLPHHAGRAPHLRSDGAGGVPRTRSTNGLHSATWYLSSVCKLELCANAHHSQRSRQDNEHAGRGSTFLRHEFQDPPPRDRSERCLPPSLAQSPSRTDGVRAFTVDVICRAPTPR